MATSSLVFGPSSVSTQTSSTNMSSFGTSSFGTPVTTTASESIHQSQQTHFGVLSQSAAMPSFGFGVSSAPAFSFQSTPSPFDQSAVTCTQQTVQPSSFSFGTPSSNPFVFGTQPTAPSTTAVFSLGKRTNFDGASGDGNKRQATGLPNIT